MSKNYMEISKEDIEKVEKTLKLGFCDYELKDCEFNVDTFEKGGDINIIQFVADQEIELNFKTKCDDGKFIFHAVLRLLMRICSTADRTGMFSSLSTNISMM